jgi:hypothetical protein
MERWMSEIRQEFLIFTRLATKDLTQSEFSRSVLSIVYIKHKKKKKKKKKNNNNKKKVIFQRTKVITVKQK